MKKEYVEPIPPMCDACFNASDNDSWREKWEEVRNAISDIPVRPIPLDNKEEIDMVNKPPHYRGKYECIDIIADRTTTEQFIGFCYSNLLKYCWRWQDKNGLEDLKKAQWYLDRLIRTLEDFPINDPKLP